MCLQVNHGCFDKKLLAGTEGLTGTEGLAGTSSQILRMLQEKARGCCLGAAHLCPNTGHRIVFQWQTVWEAIKVPSSAVRQLVLHPLPTPCLESDITSASLSFFLFNMEMTVHTSQVCYMHEMMYV